jgi:hypothetical protein
MNPLAYCYHFQTHEFVGVIPRQPSSRELGKFLLPSDSAETARPRRRRMKLPFLKMAPGQSNRTGGVHYWLANGQLTHDH